MTALPSPQTFATAGLSALVVDPSATELLAVVAALSSGGFHVITAETFEQARSLMARHAPEILLTAIRLGEYNGLHLVLRGKAERPKMAAVVTSTVWDPVLLAEADVMKATFLVTPVPREELMAAVWRTLLSSADERAPIRQPFERRQRDRRMTHSAALTSTDRRFTQDRRRSVNAEAPAAASPDHVVPDSH